MLSLDAYEGNPVTTTSADVGIMQYRELAAAVRGDLIVPGDPDYDEARAVYNGMIDKHPAAIARCADTADVVACVRFGRQIGGKQIRPAGGASTHQNTGNSARNHGRFCARAPMLRQACCYSRFARIHCENSHFSPELGGRPACSVR